MDQDLKEFIEKRLEKKFPKFKNTWSDLVKNIGDDFVNLIRTTFENDFKSFYEIGKFKISVVVDNNFVFGQIKALAEKNKPLESSFIFRMSKMKSIQIFAPFKFKEELYEKIETVLAVNNSLAKDYADRLLYNISVQDAQWTDEWKKANNLIGSMDSNDVPYLALAFDLGAHSIISNDKVFNKSGVTQVWFLRETENVISIYNKGFLAFHILGRIPSILKVVWDIFMLLFKVVGDILLKLIKEIGFIVGGALSLLGNIPSELILLSLGILLLTEKGNEVTQNLASSLKNNAKYLIDKFFKFFEWLFTLLNQIIKEFKPFGETTFEIAGYLAAEYSEMQAQVSKLNSERFK